MSDQHEMDIELELRNKQRNADCLRRGTENNMHRLIYTATTVKQIGFIVLSPAQDIISLCPEIEKQDN